MLMRPEQAESHSLQTSKTNGILQVRAKGERSYESIIAIAAEIMARCEELGTHEVLVDVRGMSDSLSFLQTFKLVTRHFAELRNLRVLRRLALLDRAENSSRYQLFETLARNRGYNLRVFIDEAKAMAWLKEGLLGTLQ